LRCFNYYDTIYFIMPIKKKTKPKSKESLAKEMFEAGVHFGHKKSNWNPKMKQYIYGLRNNVYILDLEKTVKKLEQALSFIKEIKRKDGKILFVGTRPQCQELVKNAAQSVKMPYIVSRWIGGLLTNFTVIRKRVDYLISLEKKKDSGELKKYTKKEQIDFNKEIEKLKKKFEGIKSLEKLPDVIIILSIKEQATAIREAKRKNIPIVSLVDTNCDPSLVDYPIPSNDDAISALKFMVDQFEKVLKK